MVRDCLYKRKQIENMKKGNSFYTIHGGDYKIKSDPNPHINPVFDASFRPGDA